MTPGNRLYELIARKLSGEATQAELEELNTYLQGNTGDQYLYEILDTYWLQHPDLLHEESNDEDERFRRILQGADKPPFIETVYEPAIPVRKLDVKKWLSVAASIVIVASAALFIYINAKKPVKGTITGKEPQLSEVVAKPGSRSKIILPDGTQVWLNAESKITYLNTFNNVLREVNLEGEAYFDVTHDQQRPFIVHTSGVDIKVLGTAFTVKSYESDKTIEATLLRGSIEVFKKDDPAAPKVILRPHEKLVFNKELQSSLTQPANIPGTKPAAVKPAEPVISVTTLPKNKPDSIMQETSWVYNKLVFDGERFDDLAVKLERWYDVRITIKNERLKQYRFKGVFENETIQQALDALQLTVAFEYSIEGNTIRIFKN